LQNLKDKKGTRFAEEALLYLRPLLNYARRRLGVHGALSDIPPGAVRPEEIVDEALLEALSRRDEEPEESLYPRLRRYVRRAISRAVRKERPHRRQRSIEEPVGTQWPNEEDGGRPRRLIDILPDPTAPIPERVLESAEFAEALVQILAQLPDIWREPFVLHVRDGLSIREVASIEGVSVNEVKHRIDEARSFLRARLAEEYEESEFSPPTEAIFEALERVEPTREHLERIRERMQAAA